MSIQQLMVARWDNACPSGVSYVEHMRSLPFRMIELYFSSGAKGVFLTNPMTVSLLSVAMPDQFGKEFKWEGPTDDSISAGLLGGIEVWVTIAVPPNEILVVDEPESLQPLAKVELVNFVSVPGPLDRMAQI